MTSVLDHGRQPTRTTWLAGGVAAALLLAATGLIGTAPPARAATAVPLGTTASFAVLAASGITNTGTTTLTGDTGSFPLGTLDNDGNIVQTGTAQGGNGVTAQAQSDLDVAYVDAAGQGPRIAAPADLADVVNRTLGPGVYNQASALGLTGPLTLDAGGDASAVFVFQAGSSLITASGSSILLIGGAQACNVFWQVGSSATLGTDSTFVGTVLADQSVVAQTGALVQGRLLARNATVTLDSNTIIAPSCATTPPTSSAPVTTSAAPTTAPPTTAAPTTPAGPATTTAAGPGSPGAPTGGGAGGTPSGGTPTGAGGPGGTGGGSRGTGVFSQVGTVPVGSVDTGDGSAAGPSSRR